MRLKARVRAQVGNFYLALANTQSPSRFLTFVNILSALAKPASLR